MTQTSDWTDGLSIRPASADDAEALLEIYAPLVARTAVSFEINPPSPADFASRIDAALDWIVAESADRIVGYAYATALRERAAYRWSVETSAYVHHDARGRKVGTTLYRQLIRRLAADGYCNAFAAVALPNEASLALHRRLGFEPVGVFAKVGRKFGRWHDVSWWQLHIHDQPPDDS